MQVFPTVFVNEAAVKGDRIICDFKHIRSPEIIARECCSVDHLYQNLKLPCDGREKKAPLSASKVSRS